MVLVYPFIGLIQQRTNQQNARNIV